MSTIPMQMQIRMSTRMMRWRRWRRKRTMTITMMTRKIQYFSCCLLIWNSNPHHHFQVTWFVPRDALDTRLLGEEQQFGHVQPGQQLWLQRERDLCELHSAFNFHENFNTQILIEVSVFADVFCPGWSFVPQRSPETNPTFVPRDPKLLLA